MVVRDRPNRPGSNPPSSSTPRQTPDKQVVLMSARNHAITIRTRGGHLCWLRNATTQVSRAPAGTHSRSILKKRTRQINKPRPAPPCSIRCPATPHEFRLDEFGSNDASLNPCTADIDDLFWLNPYGSNDALEVNELLLEYDDLGSAVEVEW